jgi:hypothetical protein
MDVPRASAESSDLKSKPDDRPPVPLSPRTQLKLKIPAELGKFDDQMMISSDTRGELNNGASSLSMELIGQDYV